MKILLVGSRGDPSLDVLAEGAARRGVVPIRVEEAAFGLDWWFGAEGGSLARTLVRASGETHEVASFAGVVHRPGGPDDPHERQDPGAMDALVEDVFDRERTVGLHYFLDGIPVPVVNRPGAGRSIESRPYGLSALARAGFDVPRWIVSNEPDEVIAFLATCEAGALRRPLERSSERAAELVDEVLLEALRRSAASVMIEENRPGRPVRLLVVGDRCLVTRAVAGPSPTDASASEGIEPPTALQTACRSFARAEGLLVAAFEFRVDSTGGWWCVGVEPSPPLVGERAAVTGSPISERVLDLLGLPEAAAAGATPRVA